MLIIGIVALAGAIVLIVLLVGDNALARPAQAELARPRGGPVRHRPNTGHPYDDLPPLYRRFAGFAARLTPANYGRNLQHRLDLAGNPRDWTAERVLAFKGIGVVVGVALGVLLGAKHGVGVLVFPVVGAAAGFFIADVWVRNLGERRQVEIRNGLPEAIDLMTVCVEAGLGFDAALSRVAVHLEGAMPSELARVLQEMQLGKSRIEALRALVERTDVAELRSFVSALIQSSELGISIGDVLREQAKQMRLKRKQRAEEKAQKLPVKILFPLLSCLLPAMFVVVLGPAIMNIVHTFGGLTGR
jgi:tight adherence protein C